MLLSSVLPLLTLPLPLALGAATPKAPGPVHIPLKRSATGVQLHRKRDLHSRQLVNIADVETWSDSRASWYYLTIEVGTPPQPIDVHIDTGSARLLLVSTNCSIDECDMSTAFDQGASSTYATEKQGMSALFAGHSSYDGIWATDTVGVSGWALKDYPFGLIQSTSNESTAPSLMGLAWEDPDRKTYSPSYYWATDGTWAEPMFGVYLARPGFAGPNDNVNGSLLTFGGVASDAIDGEINYVPSAVKNDWYVEIDGVQIGDVAVKLEEKHIGALDTGTTGIYAPNAVLDAIFSTVQGAVFGGHGWSFPCSAPNLNLTLTIGGKPYPLYWGDLIWRSEGDVCYGNLYANGGLTSNLQGNKWILGDAFLKNVYSVFRYKPHSLGLAPLKPQYNWRTDIIPGKYGNLVDPNVPGSGGGGFGGGGAADGAGGSGSGGESSNRNGNSSDATESRARLTPSRALVTAVPSPDTAHPNSAEMLEAQDPVLLCTLAIALFTWCIKDAWIEEIIV